MTMLVVARVLKITTVKVVIISAAAALAILLGGPAVAYADDTTDARFLAYVESRGLDPSTPPVAPSRPHP